MGCDNTYCRGAPDPLASRYEAYSWSCPPRFRSGPAEQRRRARSVGILSTREWRAVRLSEAGIVITRQGQRQCSDLVPYLLGAWLVVARKPTRRSCPSLRVPTDTEFLLPHLSYYPSPIGASLPSSGTAGGTMSGRNLDLHRQFLFRTRTSFDQLCTTQQHG